MLTVVSSVEDASAFLDWLYKQPYVAMDTETTGLDVFGPNFSVRLIQFGNKNEAWVIHFEEWVGLIKTAFEKYRGRWILHNSSFDVKALRRCGVRVPWSQVEDTMIMVKITEPHLSGALKKAATRHVSTGAAASQSDLHDGMKKYGWTWATVPLDYAPYVYYAGMDVILTSRLYETTACIHGRSSDVYPLEMQVRQICTEMEWNGMKIDFEHTEASSKAFLAEVDEIKERITDRYGFSVTSAFQLGSWIRAQGIEILSWTSTGQVATSKDALGDYLNQPGLPEHVREVIHAAFRVRKLEKLVSNYFNNFKAFSDSQGIVHPSINTIEARTSRQSVTEPALQTLPKAGENDADASVVRQSVVPREEGHCFMTVDFSQVELRLSAILSGSAPLMQAFKNADTTGGDFFVSSMRQIYDDPTISKSDPRRNPIKTFWYASLYGAGVEKMAWSAGVPIERMRDIRDAIETAYPELRYFKKSVEREAKENDGWVTNAFGRKLYVDPGYEYRGTNYKLQSTAADVMKTTMVSLAKGGFLPYMILPVHDEMLFSVPEDIKDEFLREAIDTMTYTHFPLTLTVAGDYGNNWAEAK